MKIEDHIAMLIAQQLTEGEADQKLRQPDALESGSPVGNGSLPSPLHNELLTVSVRVNGIQRTATCTVPEARTFLEWLASEVCLPKTEVAINGRHGIKITFGKHI